MRQVVFLLFIVAASAFNSFSQSGPNYNVENIPAELKNRASAVIRDMQTTVDMRTPDNVVFSVKKAVTVLNKNGNEKGSLTLNYNKNTSIKNVKGLIFDAFGVVSGKFSLNNFIDESAVSNFSLFEDDRIKRYIPGMISYPYTIVYEYEIRFKQNLILPDWYANPYPDVAVEHNSFTFICRPNDQVHIKEYNYQGSADVVKSGKFMQRTWEVNNLKAFKYEPYAPDPDSYLTYIKIAPEDFVYYGHAGHYKDWDELGKWIYDDLIKKQQVLGPEVVQEVKTLVKDLGNDKDKARRIYEYVQKKTRYISVQVGIGGFQPFPAMEVQRLSYGDCKALVNYTQALLKAIGINSYYCVVTGNNFKKSIDPQFASMDQGNHIILCIPFKSDTTWLECTSQDSPFGYLGGFTDDRFVLACTESGGKVLKTPALTTQGNLTKRTAELTLDKDGNINGKLQAIFSGSRYGNYDQIISKPYTEQLKLLKDEYDIDNINFSDFKIVQKKDDNPTTSGSFQLTIEKYAPGTSNRAYLVVNAFNKASSVPEVKNRTLPVYINRGYTEEDEIVYDLPEGFSIEAKPDDQEIRSGFGSYAFSIQKVGKKLIYKRKMVLNSGNYPSGQYDGLVHFFSEINNYDNSRVIFKTN